MFTVVLIIAGARSCWFECDLSREHKFPVPSHPWGLPYRGSASPRWSRCCPALRSQPGPPWPATPSRQPYSFISPTMVITQSDHGDYSLRPWWLLSPTMVISHPDHIECDKYHVYLRIIFQWWKIMENYGKYIAIWYTTLLIFCNMT